MISSSYLKERIIDYIELKLIKPSRFKLRDQLSGINELMDSIREHGLLQPLIVRPFNGYFELIAGHRRFEALRKLRWRKAPCVVIDVDDKSAYEIALIENVQKETLDPIEEAQAFRKYVEEYGWGSVTELAKKIGKSQEYVSQRLRLLHLPEDVKELIRAGRLAPSAARELLRLPNDEDRSMLGRMAAEHRYSVRKVREAVEAMVQRYPVKASKDPFMERSKLCEKAILVLRTTLIKFDSIIEEAEGDEEFRKTLLSKRLTLHSLLDDMINYKLMLEKELRRGVATDSIAFERPFV